MRGSGVLWTLAVLVAFPADAMDESGSCAGLLPEAAVEQETSAPLEGPLLTANECEALKTQELRATLLEIPQDGEEPIELSLGIKNGGGTLRFKIPFSF